MFFFVFRIKRPPPPLTLSSHCIYVSMLPFRPVPQLSKSRFGFIPLPVFCASLCVTLCVRCWMCRSIPRTKWNDAPAQPASPVRCPGRYWHQMKVQKKAVRKRKPIAKLATFSSIAQSCNARATSQAGWGRTPFP